MDRFAICGGFYRYAVDYHAGQWSGPLTWNGCNLRQGNTSHE